jgi:tritrans,polycis-undecaprenyl-diphosphate synthase [geranylgeranyl-diphosphate specific]
LNLRRFIYSLTRRLTCNPVVYKIYKMVLWNQIKDGGRPEHIGVILDGNRRWASDHSLPPWVAHRFGADKVEELLEWCLDIDIKTITIYAFSTENFLRPCKEVEEIMKLLDKRLNKILSYERIHKNKVRIRAIGRINLLPDSTQMLIKKVEKATENYDRHYLNLALAYGGRAEITDAVKKIVEEVEKGKLSVNDIDEGVVEDHLYTSHLPKSEIDLIIRTSGEERLSGFLLWQGAYSELFFKDVYWPDFRRIDLWRAVRTYQRRERRYGY